MSSRGLTSSGKRETYRSYLNIPELFISQDEGEFHDYRK